MKNYLLYPDCFSEESINRCRFALLKLLSLYNLQPPTSLSVLIYTNKSAAFEIFLPFFKEMQFLPSPEQKEWNNLSELQKLLSPYEGNALIFHTNGYCKQPLEALFAQIAGGTLLYCLRSGITKPEKPTDTVFEYAFAIGIHTDRLHYPTPDLYASAQEREAGFAQYKPRKEITALLKILFQRNEEESITNLAKKARYIDMEAIEKEVATADKLPFYKKWLLQLRGKNPVLQQHLNKL